MNDRLNNLFDLARNHSTSLSENEVIQMATTKQSAISKSWINSKKWTIMKALLAIGITSAVVTWTTDKDAPIVEQQVNYLPEVETVIDTASTLVVELDTVKPIKASFNTPIDENIEIVKQEIQQLPKVKSEPPVKKSTLR